MPLLREVHLRQVSIIGKVLSMQYFSTEYRRGLSYACAVSNYNCASVVIAASTWIPIFAFTIAVSTIAVYTWNSCTNVVKFSTLSNSQTDTFVPQHPPCRQAIRI